MSALHKHITPSRCAGLGDFHTINAGLNIAMPLIIAELTKVDLSPRLYLSPNFPQTIHLQKGHIFENIQSLISKTYFICAHRLFRIISGKEFLDFFLSNVHKSTAMHYWLSYELPESVHMSDSKVLAMSKPFEWTAATWTNLPLLFTTNGPPESSWHI